MTVSSSRSASASTSSSPSPEPAGQSAEAGAPHAPAVGRERVELRLDHVTREYALPGARRSRRGRADDVRSVLAVDDVDLSVASGETLSLVGESGSGKTTIKKLLLRLERPDSGTVRFQDEDVWELGGDARRAYRRSVQAVFQDPYGSLNPRLRVKASVAEPLLALGTPKAAAVEQALERLAAVGLRRDRGDRFPHEFSGGQRQRIAIARAIAASPRIVLLDEPVASLDVSIQGQIINLLSDLQEQEGIGYLLITHNMAVARHLSTRVAVMYLGRIVETGSTADIYSSPQHPYTQSLLAAVPRPDPDDRSGADTAATAAVNGSPFHAGPVVHGCRFQLRCPLAMDICRQEVPALRPVAGGHEVACHLHGSGAGEA